MLRQSTKILRNESVNALLSNNEVMTIGVIGSDNAQSAKVLSVIESYTDQESNTYCYYADPDEVEQAHEMGLSYGKYRAFLKLKTLDSTITAEKIQNMTMREIRDLIDELSTYSDTGERSKTIKNPAVTAPGNRFGHEQGNGRGASRSER